MECKEGYNGRIWKLLGTVQNNFKIWCTRLTVIVRRRVQGTTLTHIDISSKTVKKALTLIKAVIGNSRLRTGLYNYKGSREYTTINTFRRNLGQNAWSAVHIVQDESGRG